MNSELDKLGGPAFPVKVDDYLICYGMTLRDYFAAKAMQADISHAGMPTNRSACYLIAQRSYEMADAMLEARNK